MPTNITCPVCAAPCDAGSAAAAKPTHCRQCGATLPFSITETPVVGTPSGVAGTLDYDGNSPADRPSNAAGARGTSAMIGRFRLGLRLGRGSFGEVFRAVDTVLQREVALKLSLMRAAASPEVRARLEREPKAAAQLHHPNIVPVFDAGFEGDQFYIASAFIEGRTLEAAIAGKPLDMRRAAGIVRKLGEALDYAHRSGVVHRDVKPANIMLDAADEPHLFDFGLAQWHAADDDTRTADGALLGTPAYMSPEQAGAPVGPVGAPSDQYALGVILYELLCGTRPFAGSPAAVMQAIREQDPRPLRTRRADVARDLEAICAKAMEKRPIDRYADCDALAADLGRWLAGEPVRARPIGARERTVRWCRKQPLLAGSLIAATSLLVLSAILGITFALYQTKTVEALEIKDGETRTQRDLADERGRLAEERGKATEEQRRLAEERGRTTEEQRRLAEQRRVEAETARAKETEERKKAEWDTYVARIQTADALWETNRTTEAVQILETCPPELRGWEYHYLYRKLRSLQKDILKSSGLPGLFAISSDSQRLAVINGPRLRIFNAVTGQLIRAVMLKESFGYVVAYTKNDTRLIVGGLDGVRLLDSTTGEVDLTIPIAPQPARSLFSSDFSGSLVSQARGSEIGIWSAIDGREVARFPGHPGGTTIINVSPDGKFVVSSGKDDTVRIWNVASKQEERRLSTSDSTLALAYSPDGKTIAGAGSQGKVQIWDAATGTELQTFYLPKMTVCRIAFHPDGRRLAVSSADFIIKLFDLKERTFLNEYRGHYSAVMSLTFSPDGQALYSTTGMEYAVKVWNTGLTTATPTFKLEPALRMNTDPTFSPDGKCVVAFTGGLLKLLDAETGAEVFSLATGASVWRAAFNSDGTRIFAAGSGNSIKAWNVATKQEQLRLVGHSRSLKKIALSSDGRYLASASDDQTVIVWDVAGERKLESFPTNRYTSGLAFSPDSQAFAMTAGNEIQVRSLPDLKSKFVIKCRSDISELEYDSTGKHLLACDRGDAKFFDAKTGELMKTIRCHTEATFGHAISPDGRSLPRPASTARSHSGMSNAERRRSACADTKRPSPAWRSHPTARGSPAPAGTARSKSGTEANSGPQTDKRQMRSANDRW